LLKREWEAQEKRYNEGPGKEMRKKR
jgi:hypothetical protein